MYKSEIGAEGVTFSARPISKFLATKKNCAGNWSSIFFQSEARLLKEAARGPKTNPD